MTSATSVLIGDHDDPHVQAVVAHLDPQSTLVFDAAWLSESDFYYDDSGLALRIEDAWIDIAGGARGWLRRIAPPKWQEGVLVGSRRAAETGAVLALLGAFGRRGGIAWLTPLDLGLIAENKLFQLEHAASAGVRVPKTICTSSPQRVLAELPGRRVVKALGPGHYVDDELAQVLFAQELTDELMNELDFRVPLLFQEKLEAVRHFRVVTVGNRVWTCALSADRLPVDWRAVDAAHDSFESVSTPPDVAEGAVAICRALGIGYSSQDWIETAAARYLVDVNPGGQWLFLPDPVASDVSRELARWLRND